MVYDNHTTKSADGYISTGVEVILLHPRLVLHTSHTEVGFIELVYL